MDLPITEIPATQQIITPQLVQTPEKKNNGVLLVILVVFALILAAGGVLAYQKFMTPSYIPSPPPTHTSVPSPSSMPTQTATQVPNDWKIYTDAENGYSVNYPPTGQVDKTETYIGVCNLGNGLVTIGILGNQNPTAKYEGGLKLTIGVKNNTDHLSIENWITNNCQGSWPADAKKENIQVAGLSALKLTGTGEMMGSADDQPLIIFSKDNLLYFIYIYDTKEIYKQILSTFKLIDTDSLSKTSDWIPFKLKTLTNYGFTFNYPGTWQLKENNGGEDLNIAYIYSDKTIDTGGPEGINYYLYVSLTKGLPDVETIPVKIGNYQAYKTDKLPSRQGALTYFITQNGTNFVSISMAPYDAKKPFPQQNQYLQMFDQILSTFKFD